jgi:hypothetical protein
MPELATDIIWKDRLEQIGSEVDHILFFDTVKGVDQDEEWCEVDANGEKRRMRFHDYSDVFDVPGLYEELFYERLECCSPSYISNLLESVVREYGECLQDFRVIDVGAGNGMMGDELVGVGVRSIIGIDIIPSAKEATNRDRPDALGFGDIPPLAFAKALDLIATPGWLAFNLKESFLSEQEESGFSALIRTLNREGYIQTLCYRRYQHRISTTGEPLFYVAVIARKLKDLDSELLESLQEQ